jgi:hypothetical protein
LLRKLKGTQNHKKNTTNTMGIMEIMEIMKIIYKTFIEKFTKKRKILMNTFIN